MDAQLSVLFGILGLLVAAGGIAVVSKFLEKSKAPSISPNEDSTAVDLNTVAPSPLGSAEPEK